MISNLRIAVTTNVSLDVHQQERFDVISQNWSAILESCGFIVITVPNQLRDPIKWSQEMDIAGLVLTGGCNFSRVLGNVLADTTSTYDYAVISDGRDLTERQLVHFAIEKGFPILGVCRGMQLLNLYFGGKLVKLHGHAGSQHSIETTRQWGDMFPGMMPDSVVNSYHNYGISAEYLAKELQVLATSDNGKYVEAFHHSSKNVLGLMWHPERFPPFSSTDLALISNFLSR